MKISIIIPTCNRADTLRKALESALAQTYKDYEIIVADNASTDETYKTVKSFVDMKVRYFRNDENIGMVRNWRKALFEYAVGDYFLILSDDDYLIDHAYLEKAVGLIQRDRDIVIVYANGYIQYENCKKENLNLPFNMIEDGKNVFLKRETVSPQDFTLCNVLFHRGTALKLNAFSNEYNLSCDSELFLKMCLYGKVGVIKDYVSVYTKHQGSASKTIKKNIKYLVHNCDCFIEPYNLAKALNIFSERELNKWEERIILPIIIKILKTAYMDYNDSYSEVIQILEQKDRDLLYKALKKYFIKVLKFKIKYYFQNKLLI